MQGEAGWRPEEWGAFRLGYEYMWEEFDRELSEVDDAELPPGFAAAWEESAVDAVRGTVIELMESAAELSVALKVDAGLGRNWDEAH